MVLSITSNSNLKAQALPNLYTSIASRQLSTLTWLHKWCLKIDRCLIMLSQQITQSKTARERLLFKQATAQWSLETINSGKLPTTIQVFPKLSWGIWWPIYPSHHPKDHISRVYRLSSFSIIHIWRLELSIITGWGRRGQISKVLTSQCFLTILQHLVRIINQLPPNVDQALCKGSKGQERIRKISIPYRNKCPWTWVSLGLIRLPISLQP